MNKQPEALRLAEQLETEWGDDCELDKAAAELRRLHEVNQKLVGLLSEVSNNFTREDDLPDELLPRIDDAIAKATGEQP